MNLQFLLILIAVILFVIGAFDITSLRTGRLIAAGLAALAISMLL